MIGVFNLLSVNWKTLESADLYEKLLVNIFHCQILAPPVFFPTCAKNTFNQFFVNDNSIVIAVKFDDSLLKNFNLSERMPMLLDLNLTPAKNEKKNRIAQNFELL